MQVQNRIQMLQQYRQQQRQTNPGDSHDNQQHYAHRTSHQGNFNNHQYQPLPHPSIPHQPSHPYGTSNVPPLLPATMRNQQSRHQEKRWPVEEHTYCELDSTDSSLCWSSYLMPIDYQSRQSGNGGVNARLDSSLDLSTINEMSIDELHTLEQSLETSLTEISSILPHEESAQHLSSFRKDEVSAKLQPRNSTPNLHNSFPQTLSLYHSTNAVNAMRPPSNYQHASNVNTHRRNTISHPISSSYRQAQQQRIISVQQPVSSGEYSEYIQRLAFEGDSTNDSSVLDSTFTSYRRGNLLSTNLPTANRARPACIGQDSSLTTVQNLSTFTHSNHSSVQLEDPGSDSSESDLTSRIPSGDSNPDAPDMTMDSDATCFMENPMCVRPVTYRQKQSRYKTVTNRLRKVGQQIKNKGPKTVNLKTLAVL